MSSGQESIESLYHEAYALVDQGICYDEVGNREGALAMYEKGLILIDKAGQMPRANGHVLYSKMAAAREHILYRLKDLRCGSEGQSQIPDNLPPTYDVIDNTLQALGDSKSADQLFEIPNGVQLFFIEGEETSIPSYPTALKIFKFKPDSPRHGQTASAEPGAPAFMQVEDWMYPLLPGRSPVLHSNFGAYLFPNPTVDHPELCVGIILPQDLDQVTLDEFKRLLAEYTEYRVESEPSQLSAAEQERLSVKLSTYLIKGGEMIAWGVQKGTELGSDYLKKEGEKQRSKIDPNQHATPIDPRISSSVHYLRKGSKVAVKVSGYLVSKVGEAAIFLGQKVAKSAEKRIATQSKGGATLVGDTVEIVKGGVTSIATVWMGLERAAKILAKNIANETVLTVGHKYGTDAAKVTNDALYAAGHGGMAAYNVTNLGPKAIAKRTAKQAGIGFLQDLGAKESKQNNGSEPSGSQK